MNLKSNSRSLERERERLPLMDGILAIRRGKSEQGVVFKSNGERISTGMEIGQEILECLFRKLA